MVQDCHLNLNLEAGNIGKTALPAFHKQSPLALKKQALRNVQNENNTGKRKHRDITSEENAECVNTKPRLQNSKLPEQQRTCVPEPASVSVPSLITSPENNVQQKMEERFSLLPDVLKRCDDCDQRNYTRILGYLSSAELNRLAVKLEKRSMLLSVEEAIEIERTKALNILGSTSKD